MNTSKEFDYQTYMKGNPPDLTKIHRGADVQKERFEASKKKSVFYIDEDIVEQFQQIALQDNECQNLINQALREWLAVKKKAFSRKLGTAKGQVVIKDDFKEIPREFEDYLP